MAVRRCGTLPRPGSVRLTGRHVARRRSPTATNAVQGLSKDKAALEAKADALDEQVRGIPCLAWCLDAHMVVVTEHAWSPSLCAAGCCASQVSSRMQEVTDKSKVRGRAKRCEAPVCGV